MGKTPAAPLRRDRAKAGDWLVVIGGVGLARAGLLLQELKRNNPRLSFLPHRSLLAAQNTPSPPLDVGPRLSRLKSRLAALDLSDGLACDALRFSDRGRPLGAEFDLEKLPIPSVLQRAALRLSRDPRLLALQGGEDYALLIACPEPLLPWIMQRAGRHPAHVVGRLVGITGLRMQPTGSKTRLTGFDHFKP
jgi:thiamine-monophosphate kinase